MARHAVLSGLLVAAAAALAVGGCTSILGNFSSSDAGAPGSDASAQSDGSMSDGRASSEGSTGDAAGDGPSVGLGTPCTSAATCAPGQSCTDGVCCESACDGVCEACNLQGTAGHCEPIPANTDPDNECRPVVVAADAGAAADGGTGDGATQDGGDAEADAAPADDGGSSIVFPDSGVAVEQNACAGTCNGNRACQYPGSTTRCGTQFCASSTSAAGFVCDGQGACGLSQGGCSGYACESTPDAGADDVGACKTTCTQTTDCDDTAYCNGQHCLPRDGNGVTCVNGTECQSGYCVGGVCCSSACDPSLIPGATCTSPGNVGTCECSVSCDGGTCELFYPDADGDGYGDEFGTGIVGCSVGAPPHAGYVANNSDCDDGDPNVYPGQSGWFTTASAGKHTFDYNCDGTDETQFTAYSGATCQFCSGSVGSCTSATTCSTSGTQSYLDCSGEHVVSCIIILDDDKSVRVDLISPIQPLRCEACGSGTSGFLANVACGAAGTYATCGECSAASGGAPETTSSVTQGCH